MDDKNLNTQNRRSNLLQDLLTAWREAPREVLWAGYKETPKRRQERWFFIYYFLPAIFFPFSAVFFLHAITPIPALDDAPILEGTAKIYPHPSRGIALVTLVRSGRENLEIYCRRGSPPTFVCLPTLDMKYQDKPARIWILPRIIDLDVLQNVALQIELDGKVVYSYKEAINDINSGGLLFSNTSCIVEFLGFLAYWLWVIIGFPYLNYKHWKKEQ